MRRGGRPRPPLEPIRIIIKRSRRSPPPPRLRCISMRSPSVSVSVSVSQWRRLLVRLFLLRRHHHSLALHCVWERERVATATSPSGDISAPGILLLLPPPPVPPSFFFSFFFLLLLAGASCHWVFFYSLFFLTIPPPPQKHGEVHNTAGLRNSLEDLVRPPRLLS